MISITVVKKTFIEDKSKNKVSNLLQKKMIRFLYNTLTEMNSAYLTNCVLQIKYHLIKK